MQKTEFAKNQSSDITTIFLANHFSGHPQSGQQTLGIAKTERLMTKKQRKNELIIKPSNRVVFSNSKEKRNVLSNFGLHKRRSTNTRRVRVCLCSNQRESCSDEGWENVSETSSKTAVDVTTRQKQRGHYTIICNIITQRRRRRRRRRKKRRRRRTKGTKRQSIHIMGCITSYKKYEALRAIVTSVKRFKKARQTEG